MGEDNMRGIFKPNTGNSEVGIRSNSKTLLKLVAKKKRESVRLEDILEAPRKILYKEKRKLTPGEYIVEFSTYNEY